jgi:glutamate formiminotransferase/formiminotetrahydrofolate cyclodeaminase
MRKIVECVPNFSEGRNKETIAAIAEAIGAVKGCTLLDVDPGASTNRTVYTFVGDPESVVEGALAAARVARDRIDMRTHTGEHPRFGALDVCPFIPIQNVTMADCTEISETFGRRLAEALTVPVYLYEAAAREDYRRDLADIRDGEYEGLADRLRDPRWQPDFGPATFVPGWGATATGARKFLIAYNVNILGTANQAHRIALNLREAGRGPEQPGKLKAVKGLGWYVDEYNLAQVSVNLTDYHTTPIHALYEAVKTEAEALKVGVAGSEIVGLVPREAILMAAEHYIRKENLFVPDEDQRVRLAVARLGLNAVSEFVPEARVIEYVVAEPPDEPLAGMPVRAFIAAAAARTSAPGGGSVSAVMAALGAGLGAMSAKLTYGVRKFESVDDVMRKTIPPLDEASKALVPMIDADTRAFNEYMAGRRMPRDTDEQKAARTAKMQEGLKTATRAPLETMIRGDAAWDAMCDVARCCSMAFKSDVQVGARALETGIWGAYQNVLINAEGVTDKDFKANILREAEAVMRRARDKCKAVLDILEQRQEFP